MGYCSKCGRELQENGLFCPNCGAKNIENDMNRTMANSYTTRPFAEKVIFEQEGLPKKIERFLTVSCISLLMIGVIVFIFAFTAEEYKGLNWTNIGATLYMNPPSGITDTQRNFLYVIGFLCVLVGAFCIDALRAKNNYIKVCKDHIEGSGGFGFLSKNFFLEYDQIQSVTMQREGFMPAVYINTRNMQKYYVFADEPMVIAQIIMENLRVYNEVDKR